MVATKLITAEELERMGTQAERLELIEGELHDVPAAGLRHGAISGRLAYHLSSFVADRGMGEVVTSETGFIVGRNPDSVLAPDVSFVACERLRGDELEPGFAPFAPDIAVEIESPTNTQTELLRKVALYLNAGTRLVWLVRPVHRTITVFRPDRPELVLTETETLDGGDVLPGFQLALSDLFRPPGPRR